MALPVGSQVVVVTGTFLHPNGAPFVGRVTFTPEPAVITTPAGDAIVLGETVATLDNAGHFTVTLLATNASGFTPTGWTYRVVERWWDASGRDYPVSLPAAAPAVNLADIAPTAAAEGEYTVVTGPAGPAGPKGDKGDPGEPGGSGVSSVNTQTGDVVLDAADVGADAAGAAATAQTNAIATAATDATSKVTAHTVASDPHGDRASASTALSGHVAAADPHGDRAAATAALAAHEADSTNVHGITNTATLETQAGAQTKADSAQAAAISVAATDATAKANSAQTAATSAAATDATAKVAAHVAATDPHGDRAFTTSSISTHTSATDPHGDRADAASKYVALAGDQVISGEKTFNDAIPVLPATDPAFANQAVRKAYADAGDTAALAAANAYTDAHAGGGGSSIRTATARITDDNLSGLPSAPSWTIVQTSAATKLQCSIAAADGDRIRVVGRFMRSGSHFLDWVLLDNTGAIAIYAGTDTSSPLGEGDPAEYPSLSFGYDTGPPMFTVASGHISGGLITVALAHQGTGSGLVYAHSTYPWKLRLENIGPEPT